MATAVSSQVIDGPRCSPAERSVWINEIEFTTKYTRCSVEGFGIAERTVDCLSKAYTAISRNCLSCHGEATVCGRISCVNFCAVNPAADSCQACMNQHCIPGFQDCVGASSKLELPLSPTPKPRGVRRPGPVSPTNGPDNSQATTPIVPTVHLHPEADSCPHSRPEVKSHRYTTTPAPTTARPEPSVENQTGRCGCHHTHGTHSVYTTIEACREVSIPGGFHQHLTNSCRLSAYAETTAGPTTPRPSTVGNSVSTLSLSFIIAICFVIA
jgi:hypothetical protein